MAERALSLGGVHLHKLFHIPLNQNVTVQRLAEQAVVKILRYPTTLGFLCRVDIICIDEIGQISAGTLSVLDTILRRIRSSTLFFGGVLIITTLDPKQLQPVTGPPVLPSPHVISSFDFRRLAHSVQASGDPILQRIQDIAHMMVTSYVTHPEVLQEFRQLVSDNCTFVTTWDHPAITNNVFRVFGKHSAALAAETAFLQHIQQEHGHACLPCYSEDRQLAIESHGQWELATAQTTKALNTKLRREEFFISTPMESMK
jgi:hypothetical protein